MADCSTEGAAVKKAQLAYNEALAKLNVAQDIANTAKQQLDTAILNLIHCTEGPRPPKPQP
jgi:hypothetical protein